MDKDLANKIIEKHNGECIICGSTDIELHHIVKGRGRRKQHENEYSVVPLCYYHHRGTKGVHGRDGRTLDLYLKRQLQKKYFDMRYTESEVREKMGGKLYW